MRVSMRSLARRGKAGLVVLLLCAGNAAAQCVFSDLQWNGEALEFVGTAAGETRRLRLDVNGGKLECLDPHVEEVRWTPDRILFRDVFGVFEARRDGAAPEMLVFLPQNTSLFLRDFGEDSRGQLLLWIYDRRDGRHRIEFPSRSGATQLPGQFRGPEALRAWREHNRARPFEAAGGRYVRSLCVRRPGHQDRFCIESVGRRGPGPAFRMTLGAPGSVQVLQNRCAPSGLVPNADSTRVLCNIFEDVDSHGRSDVLSCWMVNWGDAVRLYETLLPSPRPVHGEQRAWVFWAPLQEAFWVDTAGQLYWIDSSGREATPLVGTTGTAKRLPVFRVVAFETSQAAAVDGALAALEAAGVEAAVRTTANNSLEVQVGGWAERQEALERVDFLRQRGFRDAQVREGTAEEVAPGLGFDWTTDGASRGAFLRHVIEGGRIHSEIWLAEGRNPPVRLLGSLPPFQQAR